MPNSPRVVLPLLAAGFLIACSPSTESGSTAEAPRAAPRAVDAAPAEASGVEETVESLRQRVVTLTAENAALRLQVAALQNQLRGHAVTP